MTKQPLWEHLRDQAMQDLKNWKPESEGEVAELVAELRHFVAEYQKMRGLDPENIYSIQQGDAEKEAHLRVSRLTLAADLLEHPTPQPMAEGAPLSLVTNCHTSGPAPKPFTNWTDYFNHVQQSGVISGLKIEAILPTPEATDD